MTSFTTTHTLIAEPLEDLAWFAFNNATNTCDPAYGCCDYHQFWSLARLLTRDGKPPRGLSFFAKHLAALGDKGQTLRILLARAADCGLPTLLANAVFAAERIPAITVVDRCVSPLAQIDELAQRTGLDITTCQGELDNVEHNAFDAAITHNVMAFNSDATRQRIFNKLANGLRAGGRILSTETVSNTMSPRNAEVIEARLVTIAHAVQQRGLSEADVREVVEAGRAFLTAQRRVSAYPEKDLRRHVLTAGLSLLSFETMPWDNNRSPTASNMTDGDKSYAFVAAQKPV